MIALHEIPNGSRLYFGKTAQIKRELESKASRLLTQEGYEEILTPSFTYTQYQEIDNQKDVIRLSGEYNKTLALRADTTLDVVRLITSRLGRSTDHKKWFYIQPVFCYPSSEIYQIGLEEIGSNNIQDKLAVLIKLFEAYEIKPTIALSNIKIPNLLAQKFDVDLQDLVQYNFTKLLEHKHSWIRNLIDIETKEDLKKVITKVPSELRGYLEELEQVYSSLSYDNIVIAPLYYASMKYYDSMFFRAFEGNNVLARGGVYKDSGLVSSGFAIYTDNLLEEKVNG